LEHYPVSEYITPVKFEAVPAAGARHGIRLLRERTDGAFVVWAQEALAAIKK